MARRLGQHFLIDRCVASRIVGAARIGCGDTVVEIGPGRGALTAPLAARAGHLIVVEKDGMLASALRTRYRDEPHVIVLEADAREIKLADIAPPGRKVKVVGNLPYYAGTAILFTLLSQLESVHSMVLMFQKEVAARLEASPGSRDFVALSVLVQVRARVEHLMDIAPKAFKPPPRVWSSAIRVIPVPPQERQIEDREFEKFATFVHSLFAQPRKTIRNNLKNLPGISPEMVREMLGAQALPARARPSELHISDVVSLFRIHQRLTEAA